MRLLEEINLYFGAEFNTIPEFIKDFKSGYLSEDYEDESEALTHLLMFLNSAGKVL